MDTASHHNDNDFLTFESQLRDNYGKIVYSHKTQEKCADILTRRNYLIKNTQIVLSAIITTGLLIKIIGKQDWALIISTIVSAVQLTLSAFLKEYKLGETIQKHSNAALELWETREQYLSLITDLKSNNITISDAKSKRDKLLDKLYKTFKGSPRTFGKAYQEAQKALQFQEELTFKEEEIDKFLPLELRRNKN
jgi:hypothetical protein